MKQLHSQRKRPPYEVETVIIDAHLHVFPGVTRPFGPASLSLGRVEDEPGRILQLMPPAFERSASPVEMALAFMAGADVDRALFIGGPTYGVHDEYLAEVLSEWPGRFQALTTFKPYLGRAAADDLAYWMDRGFVGIKLEVPETRRIWGMDVDLLGPQAIDVWERLSERNGLLMVHLNPGDAQCGQVLEIAERFPSVRIVVAHLGQPPTDGWKEQVRLAKHPRVFLDCSALPYFFRDIEEYPYPAALESLVWAIEEVGAGKVMWGSDYPSTLRFATYAQLRHMIEDAPHISAADRDAIMGGTAEALLWGGQG
jgi:predicted TIM-barrel fold metal-dependent hydrolase